MKKLFALILILLFSFQTQQAQVARKVVVEHFTNTRCSICGSRNPALFNNLSQQPGIIHLSIHPSSPYSGCLFHQHNPNDNDARTNYYGIYGATPRLVIQGEAQSTGANFGSSSLFDAYTGASSPISIGLSHQKFGSDSMRVRIRLKAEAAHSLGAHRLFLAIAEDTIAYNAPNGESSHYHVFRTAPFGAGGMSVSLPTAVGDSMVWETTVAAHPDWDFDRIYPLALLQDELSKTITQAEAAPADGSSATTGLASELTAEVLVFPNPVAEMLRIEDQEGRFWSARLYDLQGKLIFSAAFQTHLQWQLSDLPAGSYVLSLQGEAGRLVKKLQKQ
jgi:hypothetical protein